MHVILIWLPLEPNGKIKYRTLSHSTLFIQPVKNLMIRYWKETHVVNRICGWCFPGRYSVEPPALSCHQASCPRLPCPLSNHGTYPQSKWCLLLPCIVLPHRPRLLVVDELILQNKTELRHCSCQKWTRLTRN